MAQNRLVSLSLEEKKIYQSIHLLIDDIQVMKVTKRQKISRELHRLGLKGRLLATIQQHLDYQSAVVLKQQLSRALDPKDRNLIEYWIEKDPAY